MGRERRPHLVLCRADSRSIAALGCALGLGCCRTCMARRGGRELAGWIALNSVSRFTHIHTNSAPVVVRVGFCIIHRLLQSCGGLSCQSLLRSGDLRSCLKADRKHPAKRARQTEVQEHFKAQPRTRQDSYLNPAFLADSEVKSCGWSDDVGLLCTLLLPPSPSACRPTPVESSNLPNHLHPAPRKAGATRVSFCKPRARRTAFPSRL